MINELKENKHLNRLEFLTLTKNYLTTYLASLTKAEEKDNRKILLSSLKEYLLITKEENSYLSYIIDNFDKIQDTETLQNVLMRIDLLNENTFKHYNSLGEEYLTAIEEKSDYTFPKKKLPSIVHDKSIAQEIRGLTLSKQDLMDYYHQYDAIYYLTNHSTIFDTNLEKGMDFYGCYPYVENDILQEINICVPKIKNLTTMKINIHEYKHGIDLYPYLGKPYIEQDYESIARMEEEKFVKTLTLKKGK